MKTNSGFFKTFFHSKDQELTLGMLQSIDRILRLFYIFIFIVLPIFFTLGNPLSPALIILLTPLTYIFYASLLIKFEDDVSSLLNKIGVQIGYKKVIAIEIFLLFLTLSVSIYSLIVSLI